MNYPRILAAVAQTLWAMQPEKIHAMLEFLRFQAGGGKFTPDEVAARIHPSREKAVARREGAVAVLPLHGVMSHRMNMFSAISGGTSVELFQQQFRQAMADESVKAVVIEADTPGGSVDMTPELSREIYDARGGKPIVLQVSTLAASAGYLVGTAADEVVVTPSGEVGSIGVYAVHEDVSRMLEAEGRTPTLISAGKYKVEGNPFAPLSDEARAAIQQSVDAFYDMFIAAVARNRAVDEDVVRNGFGEGRTVLADQAVRQGMADRVATLDETLGRFGVSRRPAPRNTAATPRLNLARRKLDLLAQ